MGFIVILAGLLFVVLIGSVFTLTDKDSSKVPGIISIAIIVIGFIYYWNNIREEREIIIDGTYIRLDLSNR